MRLVTGLLFLLALASPAGAQAICSEPVEPWCADQESTFDTSESIRSCQQALQTYMRQVDRYAACLRDKADTVTKQAHEVRQEFCGRRNVDKCL